MYQVIKRKELADIFVKFSNSKKNDVSFHSLFSNEKEIRQFLFCSENELEIIILSKPHEDLLPKAEIIPCVIGKMKIKDFEFYTVENIYKYKDNTPIDNIILICLLSLVQKFHELNSVTLQGIKMDLKKEILPDFDEKVKRFDEDSIC